jgi:hypothetical protein
MPILSGTEIYKSWLKIHMSEFNIFEQVFEVGQSVASAKYQQIYT